MKRNWWKIVESKDYTRWDLNCPRLYHPKWHAKLEKVMTRRNRRKLKKSLKKDLTKDE